MAKHHGLAISNASLRVYLSEAVKRGMLHDAGHGWFSRLSESVPLDSKAVGRLVRVISKSFPLLEFSCWSTEQINPWMHHMLARHTVFLYAPTDTLEALRESLTAKGWEAAINPLSSSGAAQTRLGEHSVILRHAISKQPKAKKHQAPIEKILVDLLVEAPKIGLMDDGEAKATVQEIVGRYLIQVSIFQSYAERRGLKVKETIPINKVQSPARTGVC
jgi:hypothetical protein